MIARKVLTIGLMMVLLMGSMSVLAETVNGLSIYTPFHTCFLAGTKVSMDDGTYKAIEDIRVEDIVKTFDENTGKIVSAKVTKLFHHSKEEMADYYLVINKELRVTPNHPIYVNNKWIQAGKIKPDDILLDENGKQVIVDSIMKVFQNVPIYNLEIETYHTYFAQGILVHNKMIPKGGKDIVKEYFTWPPEKTYGIATISLIRPPTTVTITDPKENDIIAGTVFIQGRAQIPFQTLEECRKTCGGTPILIPRNGWSGMHVNSAEFLLSRLKFYKLSYVTRVEIKIDDGDWTSYEDQANVDKIIFTIGEKTLEITKTDDGHWMPVQSESSYKLYKTIIGGRTPITAETLWSYEWDTTTVNDGTHTIHARAYYKRNINTLKTKEEDIQNAVVDSVRVNVDNQGIEQNSQLAINAPANVDESRRFCVLVQNELYEPIADVKVSLYSESNDFIKDLIDKLSQATDPREKHEIIKKCMKDFPDPDLTNTTDDNGNACFDAPEVKQDTRYLVIASKIGYMSDFYILKVLNIDNDVDIEAPVISNVGVLPNPGVVNEFVNISCDVSDNIGVDSVWMMIISGPAGFYPVNDMMNYHLVLDKYYYNKTYDIVGNYSFFILANDTRGNFNASQMFNFSILSNDKDEYSLTINYEGNGIVTKNPDQIKYTNGTIVGLNAIPDNGWIFDHWDRDLSGNKNPESIIMNGDKTVIANFTMLEISAQGDEQDGEGGNGDGNGDGDGDENEDEYRNEDIDQTKPAVIITNLKDGDIIYDTIDIEVEAIDDSGILCVEFYIDEDSMGVDASNPYVYTLNTAQYEDREHIIMVKAYDLAGNDNSASINVIIKQPVKTASLLLTWSWWIIAAIIAAITVVLILALRRTNYFIESEEKQNNPEPIMTEFIPVTEVQDKNTERIDQETKTKPIAEFKANDNTDITWIIGGEAKRLENILY